MTSVPDGLMLPTQQLETDLRETLASLSQRPLVEVLLSHGVLRTLASELLQSSLRTSVSFSDEEARLVNERLWHGLHVEPPGSLQDGWLDSVPAALQPTLRERWDRIRLQKWMEETYRDQIEPYFLERREDLEQVVYGMIRLRHQGAAEELYLRLLDDHADFGALASQFSLGEERFTRGLVGPMLIHQPHPAIRSVLQGLAIGDLHPPFRVDQWVLLVRMEHRQPARLTEAMRLQLAQELLQKDLETTLDAFLAALYPQLLRSETEATLSIAPGPNEAERDCADDQLDAAA